MITDYTLLNEDVSEEDFLEYMGINPRNNIFEFSRPYGVESYGIELNFGDTQILRIYHPSDGSYVLIGYWRDTYTKEIVEYFGLDYSFLTSRMKLYTFGDIKKVMKGYIKLIEEYRTTDLNTMMLCKMKKLEDENISLRSEMKKLVAGVCMINDIPGELIVDIIKK